jgi:uncharacterized protein YjiS (DUF1127 family)
MYLQDQCYCINTKSREAKMPHSRTDTLALFRRTALVRRLRETLVLAAARRRDRRLLSRLDAHILRDIGLSENDAQREAAKPFWRP